MLSISEKEWLTTAIGGDELLEPALMQQAEAVKEANCRMGNVQLHPQQIAILAGLYTLQRHITAVSHVVEAQQIVDMQDGQEQLANSLHNVNKAPVDAPVEVLTKSGFVSGKLVEFSEIDGTKFVRVLLDGPSKSVRNYDARMVRLKKQPEPVTV